jgi:hypothetical protein
MITVFGHLQEEPAISGCVTVQFNGGINGGNVVFFFCDSRRLTTLPLNPGQNSLRLCVKNNSWEFSDPSMTTSLLGICFPEGPDDPDEFNGFTVERTSDGLSTYVQYDSNYSVNDIVNISGAFGCYEIMSTAIVPDPHQWPTITRFCGSGGPTKGGPVISPT